MGASETCRLFVLPLAALLVACFHDYVYVADGEGGQSTGGTTSSGGSGGGAGAGGGSAGAGGGSGGAGGGSGGAGGGSGNIGGHSTSALSFDGSNDMFTVSRGVATDFTIEMWIKTTVSNSGALYWEGRPLVWADVGGQANDFAFAVLNDRIAFGVGQPSVNDWQATGASIVTTGTWTHVAAVRDATSGELTVLVNGVEDGSQLTSQHAPLDAASSLSIGGASNMAFDGLIDELRVWNVVRSAGEIQATMDALVDPSWPGLVGYWRLDEGSGTQVLDASPSGNDGVLGDGNVSRMPQWSNDVPF